MVQVVRYLELMRRGVGKFARDLKDDYILVSNEAVSSNTIAILKAQRLADIFKQAHMFDEAEAIEGALGDIKERISEVKSRARRARKS